MCRRCQDTGFNPHSNKRCECGEGDSQFVIESSIYDLELEEGDIENERREWEEYLPSRDHLGRFLVMYGCPWADEHYTYMSAEDYLAAGGHVQDLARIKRHEIDALLRSGSFCPHCKRVNEGNFIDLIFMEELVG